MCQVHKKIMLCLSLFLYSITAFALPEDSKEIVTIISDTSTYNYKMGINIFEGNVKVDQGTTHIRADRLITKTNSKHKIEEAIAYGSKEKLAHYWTLPKIGDAEIHAKAIIIKFYPIESNVLLQQNVVVTQGENNFQGEYIFYNRNDQTITVPSSKNGRAVLVYNPDK